MENPLRIDRRDLMKMSSAGVVLAMAEGLPAPAKSQTGTIEAEEHWVMKGPVKLYIYRKRLADAQKAAEKPVLSSGPSMMAMPARRSSTPSSPGSRPRTSNSQCCAA
jgi:hypothetical protein